MNILFVTHVVVLGGANRSMLQLIKELKEKYGVFVAVVGPNYGGSEKLQEKLRGINVEYIDGPILSFKTYDKYPFFRILRHLCFLYRYRNFYKQLLPYHFDIVHTNSSLIDFGALLSRQLKCKHVWHLREYGDLDYGFKPMGGVMYEKYTYRHADAFVAISKSVADHYSDKINPSKMYIIYNGIKDISDSLQTTHNNSHLKFFTAGYIHEGKNQKELVLAVDELVNKRKITDFDVTFMGEKSEPYTTDLMKIISDSGIGCYISFQPSMDGIQKIASQMDVGVVSSRAEAFGRVTVEYMLQNLLVIACNSGANPEIIEDGKTGYIYEAGSYLDLADKMESIICAKKFPWEISENGMLMAKKNFLSTYNTERIYNLYCELLENRK